MDETNDISFTPSTRLEELVYKILRTLNGGSVSPEQVGQAMEEYAQTHPEFFGNIPEGTITRDMLADGVPEQIRDETLRPMSAEEITTIFNRVFHP